MKKDKRKEFIEIFAEKAACNISVACKKVGISRRTFYNWYNNDEEFRTAIDDGNEAMIDLAETQLFKNIRDGKEQSIFFYLKTKGKHRGYVEQVDNRVTINPFEQLLKELPDLDKDAK